MGQHYVRGGADGKKHYAAAKLLMHGRGDVRRRYCIHYMDGRAMRAPTVGAVCDRPRACLEKPLAKRKKKGGDKLRPCLINI